MPDRMCSVPGCEGEVRCSGLCPVHYDRWIKQGRLDLLPKPTIEERFWAKVRMAGPDECWEWTGARKRSGYGSFCSGAKDGNGRGVVVGAHRWAYESLRAEIPDGLHIDHLCRNPGCVNPWHMEPVTAAENTRRSDAAKRSAEAAASARTCKRGHEWTPENTKIQWNGNRECRACSRLRSMSRGTGGLVLA